MLDMAGFAEPGIPVLADPGTRRWDQFMDLRAGGVSKFAISKTGVLNVATGSAALPSISFMGQGAFPGTGFAGLNGLIDVTINGAGVMRMSASGIGMGALPFTFGSSYNSADVCILRDGAANTLAQRNGTNPQSWRLYNTYTDASNYERLMTVAVAADDFKIIPEAAGTGTLRGLQLGVSAGKLGFYGTTAVTKPAALTAADASTVDGTYGAEEAAVIENLRTRIGELESKLQSLGLLA